MTKIKNCKWLAIVALALLVVLAAVFAFAFPAHTDVAAAEEEIEATPINSGTELQAAVRAAGSEAKVFKLETDIELPGEWTSELDYVGLSVGRGQNIKIDVNGHKLATQLDGKNSGIIFYNMGTLTVIDSSKGHSGKVVSHGSNFGNKWSCNVMALIWNYGDLTLDVDFDVERPAPTEVGTPGYYSGTKNGVPTYFIQNELCPPASNSDEVYPASLTIKRGTYDMNTVAGLVKHFFLLKDADLTINGGTFLNTSGQKLNDSGFLACLDSVSKQSVSKEEKMKKYRHIDITITDGDFKDKNLLAGLSSDGLIKCLGTYKTSIEGEGYSVSISGGTYPMDFSAYVPDGYWMEHVQEKSQDGSIIEDFYKVATVDLEKIGATVEANDKERSYLSFESAFSAAKSTQADTRTIKLQNDEISDSLDLGNFSGELKIDLNGHKLTIEPSQESSPHIKDSRNGTYKNTFIICDNSERQNGEFVLSTNYKIIQSTTFIQFTTANTKFVLESGTIRQCGSLPSSYFGNTSDKWGDSGFNAYFCYHTALFKFGSGIVKDIKNESYNGLITIKGGNIISDFLSFVQSGDEVGKSLGELVGWDTGTNGSTMNYEFGMSDKMNGKKDGKAILSAEDKARVFVFDLGDYLSDLTKVCKFSWDLGNVVTKDGITSNGIRKDTYIVSNVGNGENFLVGSSTQKYTTLQDALKNAERNDTIAVLKNATVSENVTIGNGITLHLNSVANFDLKFDAGATLEDGASIRYGNVTGNLTIQNGATLEGATLENVTLNGDVTVKSGKLDILSGTYNGGFTVEAGASMSIEGGSFKGSQINTIDQYFGYALGAYKPADEEHYNDTLYEVKLAPNLAAQKWYYGYSSSYEIKDTDEWLYFSLYVNSGVDNFKGKTVELTAPLDFSKNAASGAAVTAAEGSSNFMPAGNGQHPFAGTFDGNNMTISNIVAQEQFVGLFGQGSSEARYRNIILKDSSFKIGSGYLDEFYTNGYRAAGAIVGEGFMSGNTEGTDWSGNITLDNVTVGYVSASQNFNGGVVGHSWGNVYIDGLNFKNQTTVSSNWKMGGVVGYLEGNFYIKKADIEKGTNPDGTDNNGLILDDDEVWYSGALVGHANGSNNTIEDCTILEPDDSLIGTTYAGGSESKITIKGKDTDLDIYRIVGTGRSGGTTEVQVTGGTSEDGAVSKGSIKTHATEDYLEFKDGEGNQMEIEPNPNGGYEALAEVHATVVVCDIVVGDVTYGENVNEIVREAKSFKLKDILGNDVKFEDTLTLTVTLKESQYGVGSNVALIIAISLSGEAADNYTLSPAGQQAFLQIDVQPAMLYVGVNSKGEVTYDGFVNGEDESVLSGELVLERNGNVVTPGGLTSENYNIIFLSGIVDSEITTQITEVGSDLTQMWIGIAVVCVAAVVALSIGIAYRRKKQ